MEPSPEQGKVGITNPSIQCWGMSRGLQIPSDSAEPIWRNLRNQREIYHGASLSVKSVASVGGL